MNPLEIVVKLNETASAGIQPAAFAPISPLPDFGDLQSPVVGGVKDHGINPDLFAKLVPPVQDKIQFSLGAFDLTMVPLPEDGFRCVSKGPQQLPDGSIYEGEWNEKGQKHGVGVLIYLDGGIYSGRLIEDRRDGFGRRVSAQGDCYEGNWLEDAPHDFGTYTFGDCVYEGNFVKGAMSGAC